MRKRPKRRGPFWEAGEARHGQDYPSPREMGRAWREHLHDFFGQPPEDHWFFGGRRFKGEPWGPEGINPMLGMFLSKGGGLLPLFVLYLLSQQPRYGNEIMSELETRTEGRWSANPGAIYPLLDMFEQQGLVKSEWEDATKRTRRFYRLTESGEIELNRLKEVMRPKLEEVIIIVGKLLEDLYAE